MLLVITPLMAMGVGTGGSERGGRSTPQPWEWGVEGMFSTPQNFVKQLEQKERENRTGNESTELFKTKHAVYSFPLCTALFLT